MPTVALVAATAVWGSTFAVTKGSLDAIHPSSFLMWRFGVAAATLLLLRPSVIRHLDRTELRRSGVLGAALGCGFLLQTVGLTMTSAGTSGFLTGTAVVLTPVAAAVLFRDRVGWRGWAAVALSAVGIVALTGGVGAPPVGGAALTLAGAACFAVHIAGLSQWATRENAYRLTAASVTVAAALCGAAAAADGGVAVPEERGVWQAVLYVALAATCVGFAVQAWAQSALSATTAAVVMTMEPVFAAVAAVALGGQAMGRLGWVGGLLVVGAMGLAELGPRGCCDAMSPRVECC